MKRQIVTTSDGSATIYLEEWDEHYHSKHGAIQEAYHVFIHSGFRPWLATHKADQLHVLEIGFGTGLNAFITYLETQKHQGLQVHYQGVEAYPVSMEEVGHLNYLDELKAQERATIFDKMHREPWGEIIPLDASFSLKKRQEFFDQIQDVAQFDLIYFDAFGARVQPELWEVDMFERMYRALRPGGILVTYAAKGSVRRAMQQVGFETEKLPGPPGKREMLRAVKKA